MPTASVITLLPRRQCATDVVIFHNHCLSHSVTFAFIFQIEWVTYLYFSGASIAIFLLPSVQNSDQCSRKTFHHGSTALRILLCDNEFGTFGEARGKIILLPRFDFDKLPASYAAEIHGVHFPPLNTIPPIMQRHTLKITTRQTPGLASMLHIILS
jgi:hypothetical protein